METNKTLKAEKHNTQEHAEESYWPVIVALSVGSLVAGIITLLKGIGQILGITLTAVFIILFTFFIYKEIKQWPRISSMSVTRIKMGGIKKDPNIVGSVGMPLFLFLVTEIMLFGGAFGTYFFLSSKYHIWPPQGTPHLDQLIPTIQTGVLILSSLMIEYAQSAVKKGKQNLVKISCIGTTILGAIFLILQFGIEWPHLLFDGVLSPSDGLFGASFFVLTGIHGLHVVAGVAALLVVSIRAIMGQFSEENHGFLEAASVYWHFVHIVWLFLFALLWQGALVFN